MSDTLKTTVIRCRAIIFHGGALLVVKHRKDAAFYALPGGHIEWGESITECMSREITEELGIKPDLGRLLFVHTFTQNNIHSVEFFFEVKNAHEYAGLTQANGSHATEIHELRWVSKDNDINIMPVAVHGALKNGELRKDSVRFIVA